jgi:hypothetical protein
MTGNEQIAFAQGRGNAGISRRHYRPLAEQNVDVVPKA